MAVKIFEEIIEQERVLDPEATLSIPVHALNFATGPGPETAFEINSTSGNIRIDKTY